MHSSYALHQPKGYYVAKDGGRHALCRKDGTKVWCFDPATVLKAEIMLVAFNDHTKYLTIAEDEWERIKTVIQGCD